jgi:hypothetical protein
MIFKDTTYNNNYIKKQDSISTTTNNNNYVKEQDSQIINKLNSELINISLQTKLNKFSDDHYISIFDSENDFDIQSNSPISMSPNSISPNMSENEEEDEEQILLEDSEEEEEYDHKNKNDLSFNKLYNVTPYKKYKKLSYKDVEHIISKYYDFDNNFSNEFNLITTYLKGQKNLYAQSTILNQYILNFYDLLIILLTTGIAIFSPFIYQYTWSVFVFCSVNSLISILYSIVKLLKIETSINTFMVLSNKYDKLQTLTELTSNKLIYIKKKKQKNDLIIDKINFIENKLGDLKDTYPILIPNFIKHIFPIISHVNIFVFIKKIQGYKTNLIINLKNVKNEIRYIYYKYGFQINYSPSSLEILRIKKRLKFLFKVKENIKNEILSYKNAYNYIDQIFCHEIKQSESITNWFLIYFKCKKYTYSEESNPIIRDVLRL